MKQMSLCIGALLMVAIWTGGTPSAGAQLTGQITGVISGPNGPIGGLTVNIVNGAGSVVGTAVTSSTGVYTVGNLAVGTYTIQVLDSAGAVLATGLGTVAPSAIAATVNLTLTATQLTAAALGAGAAGGISTVAVLTAASAAAAGVFIVVATRADSSPTR